MRLAIYDVAGWRVVTLVDAQVESGRRAAAWDGRDETGAPVAAGVYFARLEAGGEVASRKLVLKR